MDTNRVGPLARRAGLGGLCAALAGCAGVNFYADKGLTSRTGIPIYGSKPYVLVVRTQAEDKPVEVSIQYLPDYDRVIYADPRSGFGTAKLTMALANGQLTSFGQETDTKVAEIVTALSGVLTARAGAAKTLAEAAAIKAGLPSTAQSAESISDDVLKQITSLAQDMKGAKFQAERKALDVTANALIDAIVKSLDDIVANATQPQLRAPAIASLLAQQKDFAKLPAPPAGGSPQVMDALNRVANYKKRLETIVEALKPPKPPAEDFELYEIVTGGKAGEAVTLRRVQ